MAKTAFFIFVLVISSLQLSSFAQTQFLPLDDVIAMAEEEIIVPGGENQLEEGLEFNENTPEEIKAALSGNLAQILGAFGQALIARVTDDSASQNQNVEGDLITAVVGPVDPELGALVTGFANVLVNNAQPIGDALGGLVADGIAAFRDAQSTNADGGASVSAIVVSALGELNNNAQVIADSVQKEFDAALANLENAPEEAIEVLSYVGEGVERLINAVANRADVIGEIVAQAVNNAVSQGGSKAQQLGKAFAGLMQGFKDNAETVGDIVSETMAGLEGATEERLAGVKSDVVNAIQTANISVDEFGSGITELVDFASGDKVFGTPAQSEVEIINRLGQLLLIGLAQFQQQ